MIFDTVGSQPPGWETVIIKTNWDFSVLCKNLRKSDTIGLFYFEQSLTKLSRKVACCSDEETLQDGKSS